MKGGFSLIKLRDAEDQRSFETTFLDARYLMLDARGTVVVP